MIKLSTIARMVIAHECFGNPIPREAYELIDAVEKAISDLKNPVSADKAQQPMWDGEGLPPVGCDVEFTLDTDKYSVQGNVPENGQVVNVVAHKQTTDGNAVAVVYWDEHGAGRAAAFIKAAFRPLRTEAERKRDEFVSLVMGWMHHATHAEIEFIFKNIEAGKIPGVEISK